LRRVRFSLGEETVNVPLFGGRQVEIQETGHQSKFLEIAAVLKRSDTLVKLVRMTRRVQYDVAGGVRSNSDVVRQLAAFAPNSGGSLLARSSLTLQTAGQIFPLMTRLIAAVSDRVLISPIPIKSATDPATLELAALLDRYGSDKSARHQYHLLYARLLSPKRNEKLRLLEIGLGTNQPDVVSTMGAAGRPGASLRAFRDFLPNAEIFGADIDKRILFSEDRIKTFFVDQTNPASFEGLRNNLGSEPLDFVIDDGLHSPDANLASLIFAIGVLKKGGHFIVEDIAHETGPIWQTVAAILPEEFYPTLIQAPNAWMFIMTKP
jgi:hypothetical protein